MADLPHDRVVPGKPPFSSVGIDCFGPFLVKRGRSQEKRYGCIFSCSAVRAIHIEMLHSLESDSFLNALMRFVARRGKPEMIRSDNGTNFVGGNSELVESVKQWENSDQFKAHLLSMHIKWEFNPPAASHMGGSWERIIRSVRKVLNTILRDPKPLTPNDLLLLNGRPVAPPGKFSKADIYSRRWRHVQYIADQFWRRWVQEYLPTLQLRPKWKVERQNIAVGDVVLVANENTPRRC